MAISRPFLLVALGVILLGATAFAVQNARDRADGSPGSASAQQTSQPTGGSLSADQTLSAAFSGNGSLDSAKVDVRLGIDQVGGDGQGFDFKVKGAFQSRGKNQMPLFAMKLNAKAGGTSITAGAVSVGDRAFLLQRSTAYPRARRPLVAASGRAQADRLVWARAAATPAPARSGSTRAPGSRTSRTRATRRWTASPPSTCPPRWTLPRWFVTSSRSRGRAARP